MVVSFLSSHVNVTAVYSAFSRGGSVCREVEKAQSAWTGATLLVKRETGRRFGTGV